MLSEEIRVKIEKRFGKPIVYHKDCEALAESIEKAVNERIGVTTLKRLYGIDKDFREPRKYTLNVLAQYLGYPDWASLNDSIEKETSFQNGHSNGNNETKSHFGQVNEVTFSKKP